VHILIGRDSHIPDHLLLHFIAIDGDDAMDGGISDEEEISSDEDDMDEN